ncbi:MAG: 8-amino-7-oxononanoate synthase [Glaciecola sp.]
MAFDHLQDALTILSNDNLRRRRTILQDDYDGVIKVDCQHYLNFSSNDYLGHRQHQDILQSYVEGLSRYGAGAGASPLVTGHSQCHQALEDHVADSLNREAVLLFSSGFAANQAICQALMYDGDTIVSDKLMHASFIDAAIHSPAQLLRFKHNDIEHANQQLTKASGNTLCVSEGVFSMDGDKGELAALQTSSAQHNAWFMLDDAHGFGVLGETGMGSVEAANLSQDQCQIVMGTFGKAIGTGGAFVAGSQVLIDYLINKAKHYIYSTAFSAAQAKATLTSIELVKNGGTRHKLHDNIQYFKTLAKARDLPILESDSAIQPYLICDPAKALAASECLKQLGLWVNAIRSPTVPKGSDRLRITLSALHQEKDIDALVDGLTMMRTKIG